jgi:aminodeoxyfutalosine synthase
MVALARLALGARSIEVDWSLYGPKLAQVALTFGADHLDGISAEENATLGPRRATIEDVERNIKAAGFIPKEHRP